MDQRWSPESLATSKVSIASSVTTTEKGHTKATKFGTGGMATEPADLAGISSVPIVRWKRHYKRARLWAEDRFRLGFALGSGLPADLMLDLAMSDPTALGAPWTVEARDRPTSAQLKTGSPAPGAVQRRLAEHSGSLGRGR